MSSKDLYKPADRIIGHDKNVWYANYIIIIRIVINIITIIIVIIIIIIIKLLLFQLSPVFLLGSVDCVSSTPRCLETQHFPQQVSSSKNGE